MSRGVNIMADTEPLLRRRASQSNPRERWVPPPNSEWDPDLPYGGKVYLARKKLPDPLWVKITEAVVLIGTIAFALYAYYYFENLHFHVTHGYAHLGFPNAQHQVGQRYLHGAGVEQDHYKAMHWFRKASDQGHPHASFNLAVGHLKGYKTGLERGAAHRLISHAASKGVKEAHQTLNEICSRGGCDD